MSQPRFPRLLGSTALIVLVTACAESPLAPLTPEVVRAEVVGTAAYGTVNLTGSWSFHEDAEFILYSQAPGQGAQVFRCSTDGTYNFVQTGETFTGTYDQVGICTAPDGTTMPNDFTNVSLTGTIKGRHVRWATSDGCFVEGTFAGPSLDELRGGGRCRLQGFGAYVFSWSASR